MNISLPKRASERCVYKETSTQPHEMVGYREFKFYWVEFIVSYGIDVFGPYY